MKPFRFGVQIASLDPANWMEQARRIEAMGYSSVMVPDHFNSRLWDPTTLLAGVAAVTDTLKVGSLVYDVDYRHPVIYARQAATLHLISKGRHEFGIGAGWMVEDYEWAGMRYDRPGLRIQRLEEALHIIRGMWDGDGTTLDGKHFQVNEIPQAAELPDGERPSILIGGGGPKLLALAGREADIVGISPMVPEGRISRDTLSDVTADRVSEKVRWVREAAEAAGRDPDDIELNVLVFAVDITDDPIAVREAVASNSPLTPDDVAGSPFFIIGSANEIRDALEKRREDTGINYIVIQAQDPHKVEQFAEEVVAPLAGT